MKSLKSSTTSLRTVSMLLAGVAAVSLSSCNRGMGCPTNFSLSESVADLAQCLLATLALLG
ncbi:hypothetical protein [Lewinella sp. 4G2]|uniref:hypothetical protein n=1 Tax=Lewinella sp. 4G2 TaxID=1803372 RepID=UPI00082EBC3C|nr:hypothetical protein [Lewinella sp. 4G2]